MGFFSYNGAFFWNIYEKKCLLCYKLTWQTIKIWNYFDQLIIKTGNYYMNEK